MEGTGSTTLSPGSMIAGKYRVVRKLGEGGMGVVYEAEHLRLRQRVAIKMLLAGARASTRSSSSASSARRARPRRSRASTSRGHRRRRLDERRPVHGDGVPRGPRPRRELARRAARSRSREAVDYVLRRARRSPRRTRSASSTATSSRRTCSSRKQRDGAPRHQGARLRHLEGRSATATPKHHATTSARSGSPHLHVARADARRARRRRAHRHLVARRHPLRAARRATLPFDADDAAAALRRDHRRPTAAAARRCAGHPGGARGA